MTDAGTLRFSVSLGILRQSEADDLEAYAWQLGLDVDRRITKSLLTRTNWFVVRGPAGKIANLAAVCERWQREDETARAGRDT